jgi:hypothetical protein
MSWEERTRRMKERAQAMKQGVAILETALL